MFYLNDKNHLILIIDNLTLELWNYSTKELLKKIDMLQEIMKMKFNYIKLKKKISYIISIIYFFYLIYKSN